MRFLAIFLLAILIASCEDPILTPKPRAYPKVVYPEKAYQPFTEGYCGFTFEYPKYAVVQRDTTFFDEKPAHPCWFNIVVEDYACHLHCSYAPITKAKPADKLTTDAFKMTDWHNKKATYIQETPLLNKAHNVKGMLFSVEGPVASQLQFFLTDTAEQKHFFRGALYFYTEANTDSLAPVYDFMRKDVERMIETFEWR
jgi:gliding motility-associated lipoprotein GldD